MKMVRVSLWLGLVLVFLLVSCSSGGGGKRNRDIDSSVLDVSELSDQEDVPIDQSELPLELCAPEHAFGECPRSYTCLDGICIDSGMLCGSDNPTGLCTFAQICINANCRDKSELCGDENVVGICPDGTFCNMGICTTREECTSEFPSGSCDDGVCFGGECVSADDLCGLQNPTGLCAVGLECLNNMCLPSEYLCSSSAPAGRCSEGDICAGGECVPFDGACSPVTPEGNCSSDFSCVDGVCMAQRDLCSQSNRRGYCSGEASCYDGVCTDLACVSDFAGECPPGEYCYPEVGGEVRLWEVLPQVWWSGAYTGSGEQVDFNVTEFFCDPEYDRYSVLIFVIVAEWCAACPGSVEYAGGQAAAVDEAGGLMIFLFTETEDGLASNAQAQNYISLYTTTSFGLRVGSMDTKPEAGMIDYSEIIGDYPNGFVVRKRDMMIIADQGQIDGYIPFLEITENPERYAP